MLSKFTVLFVGSVSVFSDNGNSTNTDVEEDNIYIRLISLDAIYHT